MLISASEIQRLGQGRQPWVQEALMPLLCDQQTFRQLRFVHHKTLPRQRGASGLTVWISMHGQRCVCLSWEWARQRGRAPKLVNALSIASNAYPSGDEVLRLTELIDAVERIDWSDRVAEELAMQRNSG